MASSSRVTDQSLLQKIKGHFECQICQDLIKHPKMLECSQSYCLDCLKQLSKRKTVISQKIACPVCRGETPMMGKGVADLRTDFKMISLLDEIKRHESQPQIQPEESVSKCSNHIEKNLILYCDTCDTMVCISCLANGHGVHKLAELSEMLERFKKKANEVFADVEKHQKNFNIAIQKIDLSQKSSDIMFADAQKHILKQADEAVARVREGQMMQMKETENRHKDKAKKFAFATAANKTEMTTAQKIEKEVNLLMDRRSSCENLFLINKLLQDLIRGLVKINPGQTVGQGSSDVQFLLDGPSDGSSNETMFHTLNSILPSDAQYPRHPTESSAVSLAA